MMKTARKELLPKSKDYILYEPSAHAFYRMLNSGTEPIDVLDEAIFYYCKVVQDQQKVILEYAQKYGRL